MKTYRSRSPGLSIGAAADVEASRQTRSSVDVVFILVVAIAWLQGVMKEVC